MIVTKSYFSQLAYQRWAIKVGGQQSAEPVEDLGLQDQQASL